MCGLAGIVRLGAPPERAAAEAMAGSLVHRGPDDAGIWTGEGVALAFRRLSILDLSAAGHQPMQHESGRYTIVFNGEIYNYRELRADLEARGCRFRSGTDTEVLLQAFAEWGPRCVARLNGMWAFAVWDAQERTLHASRDRFGIKPLYYRLDGDRLAFASELKAFAALPGTRPQANLDAVRDFVAHGFVERGEDTFFAGIRRLPAAHSLTFADGRLRLDRYWSLEPRNAPPDAVEAVRHAFVDAIRLHLRSDVPVGTCLSGGIDSSAVACTVDHLLRTEAESASPVGDRQRTFTAFFEQRGFDERPYARAVVDRIGADAHWVTFGSDDVERDLGAIVAAQEEPFGSTSIVAQWFVMKAARAAGVTVMLDGQGGDEVFAGYPVYYGPRLADLLLAGRLGELGREVAAFRAQGRTAKAVAGAVVRPLLPPGTVDAVRARRSGGGALVHPELRDGAAPRRAAASAFPDRLRRALETQLTETQLPELLRYEDRNSMAHSIEARVPFLDHRLVELGFSLDGGDLIRRGTTKAVLRSALADLLPPEVSARTDKVGFVTPERDWLRGGLGELAGDVFASQSFRERGFVDAVAARDRLARHRRGELTAGFELWRALNVELWAQALL